ncbi:hypothetical protein [Burkholderia sp. Ac-20344]|uniref:hypothetical protein n=1 Tax=Burkholderia sp. Ac-20344 TaxID=2703890 RepID=UPI00197B1D24|nr:hypothetical protein [Burkholderia sp. Ac-20344]MBN3836091.1 hypothetical protein [Burkholderia sp. Ac-20344]
MVGPVFVGKPARPASHGRTGRARHGFIGHAPACASCRAAGRNNDNDSNNHIDNGNIAAIIASRIEVVAPVQPGQRAEKSGGRTHASEPGIAGSLHRRAILCAVILAVS